MTRKRANKNFSPKPHNESNANDDKLTSCFSGDNLSEKNKPSTTTLKPYNMGNSDYFLPETTEVTHVGPQYVVKEAFNLTGLNKDDIVNIDESCKNCEKVRQDKTIEGRFNKIKSNWNIKSCFLLGIAITLIEIISLGFIYYTNAEEKKLSFISPMRIDIMHNNLDNFEPRSRFSVDSNDCAYHCPTLKSKIKFIQLPQHMDYCFYTPFDISLCDRYLLSKQGQSNQSFKDTYFNYFIYGVKKTIIEGRPLTCPFDEPFLKEDHSSIITVGIPDCTFGRSIYDSKVSLGMTDEISELIKNLKEKEILAPDNVLYFPDVCKTAYLLEKVNKLPGIGRISFYKQEPNVNLNLSTVIDRKLLSIFLFDPKNDAENDTKSTNSVKIQFPFSGNTSTHDSDRPSMITNFIQFKLFTIYEHRDLKVCSCTKTFVGECWPIIMGHIKRKSILDLNRSVGNYFIFSHIRVVHGQIPVNYSNNINEVYSFVNIFLIHDSYNGSFLLNNTTLTWFSNVFESIRDDIWTTLKYSTSIFLRFCDMVSSRCLHP